MIKILLNKKKNYNFVEQKEEEKGKIKKRKRAIKQEKCNLKSIEGKRDISKISNIKLKFEFVYQEFFNLQTFNSYQCCINLLIG